MKIQFNFYGFFKKKNLNGRLTLVSTLLKVKFFIFENIYLKTYSIYIPMCIIYLIAKVHDFLIEIKEKLLAMADFLYLYLKCK